MVNPFFSIVIPVYNIESYIAECADTILKQSFGSFELILVDDGSRDGSLEVCNSIKNSDGRVKVIHQKNGGAASARNKGLDNALGEYVIFVDGDDKYGDLDAFKKIHSRVTNGNYDVVSFNRNFIHGDGKTVEADDYRKESGSETDIYVLVKDMLKNDCLYSAPWVFAIKREFLKNNNLYFSLNMSVDDVDWVIRILDCHPKIYNMSDVLYTYRVGREGSITRSVNYESQIKYFNMLNYCISYKYRDEKFKQLILNYIAYQYVIFISWNQLIDDKAKKKELLTKETELKYLLKYDLMRQTRLAHKVSNIIGFRLTEKLLGIKLKRMISN